MNYNWLFPLQKNGKAMLAFAIFLDGDPTSTKGTVSVLTANDSRVF